jgi:membrane protein
MKIPESRGLQFLFEVSRYSIKSFFQHDMSIYAAALAYRTLFAIFPFLALLLALLGFFEIGSVFEWLTHQTSSALQGRYAELARQSVFESFHQAQGGLLTSVSLIALWSISRVVNSLTKALNAAYEVQESRPGWKRVMLQLLFALGLAPTVILGAALLLLGPTVIEWVIGLVGLDKVFVFLWAWLRLPVALVLLMLAVSIVYWAVPSLDRSFQLITPGAGLAVIVWVLASLGFSYYVSHFANYSVTYGSLATAVVLLLYFYISAAVLLLGAEVNAAIYHRATSRTIREEKLGAGYGPTDVKDGNISDA